MRPFNQVLFAVLFCLMPASLLAQVGGVYIDSSGMLQQTKQITNNTTLKQLYGNSANQTIPLDISRPSKLRKISLSKLEALIEKSVTEGNELPPEVKYLAGLTRVDAIFFYPEQNDIVIAGPAEGWKQLKSGDVVGTQSNRPVLHLDNLLVALRYAFAKNKTASFMGCSIEPTPEGIKNHANYMKKMQGRFKSQYAKQYFFGMQQSLGPQAVKLYGVPKTSRFALTMLAADYRMKRISMAHDPSPSPKIISYIDLAAKGMTNIASARAQYRFWFMAKYDAIYHTADRTAFQFSGHGIELLTARQDEGLPNKQTAKVATTKKKKKKKVSKAAKRFCDSFTKQFPELAARVPVFAELQNCIALSTAAELMRAESISHNRWKPTFLLNTDRCPIGKYEVPQNTPSLINYRRIQNRTWLTIISGGVKMHPRQLAAKELQQETKNTKLAVSWQKSKREKANKKKNDNWWWD